MDTESAWKILYEQTNEDAAELQFRLTLTDERNRRLQKQINELVDHINSLPEGHYSPWLTHWAKNNG